MRVLIKRATIVSSSSPFNGQVKDILVQDGIIHSISNDIYESADQLINTEGLHASIGWMDIFSHFCDPGFEFRETLESGAEAAASGGFTDVMLLPNTSPVVHSKSQVQYIVQRSASLHVNIHAIGAVTKNAEGKELSEMYDMYHSGAVAFSDGINAIQNGGLLLKALQYVKSVDGTIIQVPDDTSIGTNGLMNEGIISTQLGLPGKPAMSEELMVVRDIELARYADSRLHFTGISSGKSLEHIRQAKALGIQVSCSVSPYHLFFSEEDLQQYDTNLKVTPPIRTQEDRAALQAGLFAGTIDCIASHHIPQDYDNKVCEFEYAKSGMIGLETLFATVWQIVQRHWNITQLTELLGVAPRKLFGLAIPELKEGSPASITLFNPGSTYVFEEKSIHSKSKNSAFTGKTLTGKVVGIINGTHVYLN